MTTQWDRFAASIQRSFDALQWETRAEIYQPSETFVPGDGFQVEYPESETAVVDAMIDTPSDADEIDPGGTTETSDLSIYVAASLDIDFVDAGESGDARTGVIVGRRDQQYVVDTVEEQFDGALELSLTEVDEWR